MAANCGRQVKVAEIAEVAGISVNRLHVVLMRDLGRTPQRLLRDIRLYRVHLALTGRAPAPATIAEAAEMAGHGRVTRFNAAYRARYGRDPVLPVPAAAVARSGAVERPPQPGLAKPGDGRKHAQ